MTDPWGHDWERELDRREAEAERTKREQAWRAVLDLTRPPKPSRRASSGRRKRPPPGTTRRARALRGWRRRARLGRSGCCGRCGRRTIPHAGLGVCASCYRAARGEDKRRYHRPHERAKLLAWKKAHRDACLQYSRRYCAKPAAKAKRRSRLRRQQKARRAEKIKMLLEKLHAERRARRQILQRKQPSNVATADNRVASPAMENPGEIREPRKKAG